MNNTTAIDKNYLRLQFWKRVYEKNATEFQSFFEDIMQGANADFQKIRPYGNQGDGGNDGYIPDEGIYFQVYAPKDPSGKEAKAAEKMKEDFEKLKVNWGGISTIKEYVFVFNDKNYGVSIEIDRALSELKLANKGILFKKLTPKDLERTFFALKSDQILALGFDIDSTNTLKIAKSYLDKIEMELDRDNSVFALKSLNNIKEIVLGTANEDLALDFEILEARTLQKLENIKDARKKYTNLCKRFPDDPRAFLYLAEIFLSIGDFKRNEELLSEAEAIDSTNRLLALEKLIRDYAMQKTIDLSKIDEENFSEDSKIKANFYRIYSGFYEDSDEHVKADSFIEKAICYNPDKFSNYDAKLSILENRLYVPEENKKDRQEKIEGFLHEIDIVEQKANTWGELGVRNKAMICYRKFDSFRIKEDMPNFMQNAKDCFEFLLQCYFDRTVDRFFVGMLTFIEVPESDLERLLDYLDKGEKNISDDLIKRLFFQFGLKDTLFTTGREYFVRKSCQKIIGLLDSLEGNNYQDVLNYLSDDITFAVVVANTKKVSPELRLKIIENLPNDGSVQKDKLLLLLNYYEGKTDKAFELLKKLDLSNLGYFESKQVLEIAKEKKAWEFVVCLLENILKYEKNKRTTLQLKLQLFSAYLKLERFKEASEMGQNILSDENEISFIDEENKEILLEQTIIARIKRGEFKVAKEIVEKHINLFKTFNSILGIKVDVYLRNDDVNKAISAVVEGIKIIKSPTPEQYGYLYMYLVEIGNRIDFSLSSDLEISDGSFVKVRDQERWYFIGNGEELDATKIASDNKLYAEFIDKKNGDEIKIIHNYRSDANILIIEEILPIERYIFWQCRYHVGKLTEEGRWKAVEKIEVPKTVDGIDLKYIIARLEDDKKARGNFFQLYLKNNLPLAFLAVNQGGLTNAIGCILNEQKGFVNFSSGNYEEINSQKEVAQKIIGGEKFYLDGTSALILGETGLLEDIYKYVTNIRVPQTVITLLLETNEKFRYIPGQSGYMSYAQGGLVFSSTDQEKRRKIKNNFERTVELLELDSKKTEAISDANKIGDYSEKLISAALCDACILAQRDDTPVLTEDFMYLKVNEMETKKSAPQYCSTFVLLKVLYEQGKIDFDKYLGFFNYLAKYRFRFLPVSGEDIEKAVFGDGDVKQFTPENIRLLNFHLTLAEEYGVSFSNAFAVVVRFLLRVLVDDAVTPEMIDKIFIEIVETFPTEKDKRTLGEMLLVVCLRGINNAQLNIILGTKTQEKVDSLARLITIYSKKDIILL